MINIEANHQFQVACERFSLYAAESTQLSISIDGTNWTPFGETFTGTKVFKDNPRSLFLKADHDLKLAY